MHLSCRAATAPLPGLLVATVLRRLGQIDALIADCLNMPLAPRAAPVHDILRLGVAQLLFLRTPPHAAVATSVDLAQSRGFLSHKGLVNAVLRRLSVEGARRASKSRMRRALEYARIGCGNRGAGAYGEATARAIATAHLKEAPLDLTLREDAETLARQARRQCCSRPGRCAGAARRRARDLAGLCRGRLVGSGRCRRAAGAPVRRPVADARSSICAPHRAARPRSLPPPVRG